MGFIYRITNDVNGKIYVGKTESPDPFERWKEHLKDYKRQRCEKRPLYEAMNKYGMEHFHFEVIEETDDTIERERYWINELRTYIGFKDCNGYNATLGGDGKSYLNLDEDEVIQYHIWEASSMIGDTAKHFNVDNNTIKKILQKHNVYWMNDKTMKLYMHFRKTKGVMQVDPKSKFVVNKYMSTAEAANDINGCRTNIARACRNEPHYAHGYLWYYGKDLISEIKNGNIIDTAIMTYNSETMQWELF